MIRSVFAPFQSVSSLKASEKDVEVLRVLVRYIDIIQHLLVLSCKFDKPAQGLAKRCQNNAACCYYDFFNVDLELVLVYRIYRMTVIYLIFQ